MGAGPEAVTTLTNLAGAGTDFYLHLGDASYGQIKPDSAWCDFVKSKVGATFPYELVAGGHDGGRLHDGLIDNFAACLPDHLSANGTYGKDYYFDYPAGAPLARVFMISPGETFADGIHDYSAGTPRATWLSDAIDSARGSNIPWVVVGLAWDCITAGEKHCEIGADLFNMLVAKRVDLILQGHEHGYERSKQLALGASCPAVPLNADGAACVADDGSHGSFTKGAGPIVVISGTSGVALRPMFPADPEAPDFVKLMGSNTANPDHGFMKYTVAAGQLTAQFVSNGGGFGDSFTIAGNPPVPPAPGPASPGPPATAPPGTSPPPVAGAPNTRSGYWMVGADGKVYPFGDARSLGDAPLLPGTEPVHLEPSPSNNGYWIPDSAGHVFAMGDARWLGNADSSKLAAGEKVTSLSATRSGQGYWIFTSKGRVLPFGDAAFYGDMSAVRLNGPVVGSIATASGKGYYMVASDGGIFSFGDARFYGSMGNTRLNAPVQSLVPDGDGVGYWLVASDGGIFAFDAPFRGSMGSNKLNKPITGMVRYGNGYLMVGEDGGIFNFSDRPFAGSLGANPPTRPIVSVAATG